jgi:hypothetical protein
MGVERRKGNLYYYEKQRIGSRVVSHYVGKGELVVLAEHQARKRQAEQAAHKAARNSIVELSGDVDAVCDLADLLLKASLLTSGFHQHNRQWRRRRYGSEETG